MLTERQHQPGAFDPGKCRECARETDLLDRYWQVKHQGRAFAEAHLWARQAHRHAICALWSAGIGIVLAAIALFTG